RRRLAARRRGCPERQPGDRERRPDRVSGSHPRHLAVPRSDFAAGNRIPTLAPVSGRLVISVNGVEHEVAADPRTPLLYVLRNDLGLTAAKFGCGLEQCRACAVIADGEVVTSCATAVEEFAGKELTTLEGIGTPDRLHPLQEAFLEEEAAQCGYCV